MFAIPATVGHFMTAGTSQDANRSSSAYCVTNSVGGWSFSCVLVLDSAEIQLDISGKSEE